MAPATSPSSASSAPKQPARLAFIDGLRGVAILLVILTHCRHYVVSPPAWAETFRFGYVGVDLFLVLSGFCIGWPYVQAKARLFDIREYASRRAWRILPAYYVALAFYALLPIPGTAAHLPLQILTHATLTQNLFPETVNGLNPIFWTLALEWQLYMLFPFLLSVFKRIGGARTFAAVLAVEMVYRTFIAIRFGSSLDDETFKVLPWCVFGRMGEFAAGMYAARLVGDSALDRSPLRPWLPMISALCLAAGPIACIRLGPTSPAAELCWTFGFFALVLAGSVAAGAINTILTWRPLAGLGVISFSVYLLHMRAVMGGISTLCPWTSPTSLQFIWAIVQTLAFIVALSYLFYRFIEKPFLDMRSRLARRTRTIAPGSTSNPAAVEVSYALPAISSKAADDAVPTGPVR